MEKRVFIFDTTLRDGEQTPGVHLTVDRKVEIARRLEAFGVDTVEAGFPVSSPAEAAAVERVARELKRCEVAALARAVVKDVDAAAQALAPAERPVVHIVLGVSDVHLSRKQNMTRPQALRAIERSVSRARETVEAVQFSAEDASRAERPFLRQCILTAVEAGARRVNLPDTVGCATPREYGALIRDIVHLVGPGVRVSAHCHNDLGLSTANTLAAIEAGAGQVEVTVNGIGERAGNAAVEEVAVALALKGIARTGLDLGQVAALSRLVSEATGVPVQPNRAVVGANAFAHSSGIHQDGILKDVSSYEFVPPALVGAGSHRFVLTARSGRSAIVHEATALGYTLSAADAEDLYAAFKRTADEVGGAVTPEMLAKIVQEVCDRRGTSTRPGFQSTCA